MHNIYISVSNYCVNSEQLGHRGIDVFVRHKRANINHGHIMIWIAFIKETCPYNNIKNKTKIKVR